MTRIQSAPFGFWNKSPRDFYLGKSLHQFDKAKERLRGVFIECLDFEKCIKQYDQPRSIFFCDPPYLDQYGYEEGFSREDHERLAKTLKEIEGQFLLTVNDCPETREIYCSPSWSVKETLEARSVARVIDGRKAAPILIVRNYREASIFGHADALALQEAV